MNLSERIAMKTYKTIPVFIIILTLLAGCSSPQPAPLQSADTPIPTIVQTEETPLPTPTDTVNGMIAFARDTSTQRDIYLINVDGSGLTAVTDDAGWDNWPSWSPDGSKLAFTCRRPTPSSGGGICTINADGSERKQLTNTNEWEPSWSPDGKHISYASLSGQNSEIYMMETDGSNQIQLTHSPAEDWQATWSPDSQRILFTSARDGDWEIYIMDVSDGGKMGDKALTQLTENDIQDGFPAWSPDGTKIVFSSVRDGNEEIYLMNADGSDPQRLTNNDMEDSFPRWSPDGKWIVFATLAIVPPILSYDITVMSVDGSQQMQITQGTSENEECPNWSP